MTKNEDILKPFEGIERQTLEVENVVEKNKYFTILFFSQLYTQLDTCQKFHPYVKLFYFYLLSFRLSSDVNYFNFLNYTLILIVFIVNTPESV